MDFDPQISPIPYEVKNASQNTGLDTTSDTVSLKAGGNENVVKVTSSKVHINEDGDDLDLIVDGDTKPNVLRTDATNNGTVMGGTHSTFVRSGSTVRSVFLANKPDEANWNAGAQGIYTNEALRAADFTLFKTGGTEDSPAAIGAASDITNIRIEGYSGASGLAIAAVIRGASDGTISDAVVPGAIYISVANASGALQQMLALRSSTYIGTNGRGTPLSGLDLGSSLGLTRRATAVNTSSAANDIIIAVTNTAAARTVDLRTADTVGRRTYIIKDESGNAAVNNITITTEGAQLIDGAATYVIATNYGSVRLYSNGSNWFTF